MEKYQDMKKRHQDQLSNFEGMFFAFSNKQFKEGMERIGLTEDDTDKICSIGAGGYLLKSQKQAFRDMFENRNKEMTEALKTKDFLLEALRYELCNHEYCITYSYEQTFEALDLSMEKLEALPFGIEVLKKAREEALACC
jgi:hypothetical protein